MTEPSHRPLTDRDYQALARFRTRLRQFLHFSEQAALGEGLTSVQHQLLLAIRGHQPTEKPPSISDLATVLLRRTHSTVELVDRAEAHDLVTSHPDPTDARRRLVTLTQQGDNVLERLSALHRRELRSFEHELTQVFGDLE